MQQKVLVLGSSGLLGWHCVQEANKRGFQCVGTYNSIVPQNTLGKNLFIKFNVDKVEECLKNYILEHNPSIVINTIANINLSDCEENLDLARTLNSNFVKKLVSVLEEQDFKPHLIHISTDSVYGNHISGDEQAWHEDSSKNPLSNYAKTKLESEELANQYGGNTTILRTAFYGKNTFHELKGLFNWVLNGAEKEINGWTNVFFSPVSALTLAKVIFDCYENSIVGTFNVGSPNGCSKYEFLKQSCHYLDNNKIVNKMKHCSKENDIRPIDTRLNSERLMELLPGRLKPWKHDLYEYILYINI